MQGLSSLYQRVILSQKGYSIDFARRRHSKVDVPTTKLSTGGRYCSMITVAGGDLSLS